MSPNRVTKPRSPTHNKIEEPCTHSQVYRVIDEFLAQFAESKGIRKASPTDSTTHHLKTHVESNMSVQARSNAPKTAIPRETAKAGSSKPLSVPLRRILSAISGLKTRMAAHEDDKLVSARSLYNCLHNWEGYALQIVQDFEEAEEQRIVDIKKAIDDDIRRDQRREQLHAEQLKAKDAELAEVVESLMEQVSNLESQIQGMLAEPAISDACQLKAKEAELKTDSEKRITKEIEKAQAASKQAFELELNRSLKVKEQEMHASFETKMAAIKKEHEERLAEELKKQKEEFKIRLRSQTQATQALKQENEEMLKKLADAQAAELSPTQQQQLFDLVAFSFHPSRAAQTQAQCLPAPRMASVAASALKKTPGKRKRTTDDKNTETTDTTPRKSPRIEPVQDSAP